MAKNSQHSANTAVVVIGLGRFGGELARTLTTIGHEVLAIDTDPRRVQQYSKVLAHVAQADASDVDALRQLGVHEMTTAIVAIGNGIESSVLVTAALIDLGIPRVWAKAISTEHRRILERVGAHHVVQPEREMGERVAHLIAGTMLEYISLDDVFVLAEVRAPTSLIGRALGESGLRAKYKVTVVCIKHPGESFTYAEAVTVIREHDLLVVAGTSDDVDRFVADN